MSILDGPWLWESDKGRVAVHQLAPRLATLEIVGRADEDATPVAEAFLTKLAPIEGIEMFWDASQLESFANSFRTMCVHHLYEHRKTIQTVAVFTRSALVSMAVSTSNLALGGILNSYRDGDAFTQARREAAARHGLDPEYLAV